MSPAPFLRRSYSRDGRLFALRDGFGPPVLPVPQKEWSESLETTSHSDLSSPAAETQTQTGRIQEQVAKEGECAKAVEHEPQAAEEEQDVTSSPETSNAASAPSSEELPDQQCEPTTARSDDPTPASKQPAKDVKGTSLQHDQVKKLSDPNCENEAKPKGGKTMMQLAAQVSAVKAAAQEGEGAILMRREQLRARTKGQKTEEEPQEEDDQEDKPTENGGGRGRGKGRGRGRGRRGKGSAQSGAPDSARINELDASETRDQSKRPASEEAAKPPEKKRKNKAAPAAPKDAPPPVMPAQTPKAASKAKGRKIKTDQSAASAASQPEAPNAEDNQKKQKQSATNKRASDSLESQPKAKAKSTGKGRGRGRGRKGRSNTAPSDEDATPVDATLIPVFEEELAKQFQAKKQLTYLDLPTPSFSRSSLSVYWNINGKRAQPAVGIKAKLEPKPYEFAYFSFSLRDACNIGLAMKVAAAFAQGLSP